MWEREDVREKLDLSDEQVETLRAGTTEIQKQEIQVNADLQKARLELNEILRADTIDEAAANNVADRVGTLAGQAAQLRVLHRVLVAKTLTAEQREELANTMAERARERKMNRPRAGAGTGEGPRGMRRGPGGPRKGPGPAEDTE
jgi:Spy/CpxP family protein refolding chaperone